MKTFLIFTLALNSINFIELNAALSTTFRQFLRNNYDAAIEQKLARDELKDDGSFGGGELKKGDATKHYPVIFINGLGSKASELNPIRNYFLQQGYTDEELYATTFGNVDTILPESMKCIYVKTVRTFIKAVSEYTNSAVNVIAYSTGSPIARKAIKGQRCVDTIECVGSPLTNHINVFLSVAGANHGLWQCLLPLNWCNSINGFNCKSEFLEDINSSSGYEGRRIYTLLSKNDEITGYEYCNRATGSIGGETQRFLKTGLTHMDTKLKTIKMQYNIVAVDCEE